VINLDKLTYDGNMNKVKDLRGQKRHKFVRGDIRNRKTVHWYRSNEPWWRPLFN
jgi:dTDP-glucose 4,6-dehydratase